MKHFARQTIQIALISSGLLLTACGGGGGGDSTAPVVDAFTPDDGVDNVRLDAAVSAEFNEAMIDLSIAEDSFYLRASNGTEVNATVSYDNHTDIATLTPRKPLALHTRYTATLTQDNVDLSGNALATTSWDFETRDGLWQGVRKVEYFYADAEEVQIDINVNGNAIAVWSLGGIGTHREIWANYYTADTDMWGSEVQLSSSASGAEDPKIVFYDTEKVIAVWSQDIGGGKNAILMKHFTDGAWGPISLVSDPTKNAYSPKISSNKTGEAAVVWLQDDGLHYNAYAKYFSGENGSDTILIDNCDTGSVYAVEATVDQSGQATFVWKEHDGINYHLKTRVLNSGRLGSPISLLDNKQALNMKLSADPLGNIMAIWSEIEGSHVNIRSRYYSKNINTWFTTHTISDQNENDEYDPQITFDHSGNAMAIWRQVENGTFNIYANRFTKMEGWETPVLLENLPGIAFSPDIKLDSTGNAIATWTQMFGGLAHAFANRYTSTTAWGSVGMIEDNISGNAGDLHIAVNSSGRAIIAWNRYTRGGSDIMVEHFE